MEMLDAAKALFEDRKVRSWMKAAAKADLGPYLVVTPAGTDWDPDTLAAAAETRGTTPCGTVPPQPASWTSGRVTFSRDGEDALRIHLDYAPIWEFLAQSEEDKDRALLQALTPFGWDLEADQPLRSAEATEAALARGFSDASLDQGIGCVEHPLTTLRIARIQTPGPAELARLQEVRLWGDEVGPLPLAEPQLWRLELIPELCLTVEHPVLQAVAESIDAEGGDLEEELGHLFLRGFLREPGNWWPLPAGVPYYLLSMLPWSQALRISIAEGWEPDFEFEERPEMRETLWNPASGEVLARPFRPASRVLAEAETWCCRVGSWRVQVTLAPGLDPAALMKPLVEMLRSLPDPGLGGRPKALEKAAKDLVKQAAPLLALASVELGHYADAAGLVIDLKLGLPATGSAGA